MKEFIKALGDYPDLQPWQEEVLTKFQGKGAIQITGRQMGKSWANAAMQRLMDDLANRPLEEIVCSTGSVFGKRYLTAEPIGGNWIAMEAWCIETFGPPANIWDTMKDGNGLGRWYMNDRKFWFLDEKDQTMFLLKWR